MITFLFIWRVKINSRAHPLQLMSRLRGAVRAHKAVRAEECAR
jgi:hypothetical protein